MKNLKIIGHFIPLIVVVWLNVLQITFAFFSVNTNNNNNNNFESRYTDQYAQCCSIGERQARASIEPLCDRVNLPMNISIGELYRRFDDEEEENINFKDADRNKRRIEIAECVSISMLCCAETLETDRCEAGNRHALEQFNATNRMISKIENSKPKIDCVDRFGSISIRCCAACRFGITAIDALRRHLPPVVVMQNTYFKLNFVNNKRKKKKKSASLCTGAWLRSIAKSKFLSSTTMRWRGGGGGGGAGAKSKFFFAESVQRQWQQCCRVAARALLSAAERQALNVMNENDGDEMENDNRNYDTADDDGEDDDDDNGGRKHQMIYDVNRRKYNADNYAVDDAESVLLENNNNSNNKDDNLRDGNAVKKCPAGYRAAGSPANRCVDIDECAENVAISLSCAALNRSRPYCVNRPGSYECAECAQGYRFDSRSGACADVNECRQRPSPCLPDQSCQNFPGTFRCYCQVGYEFDEQTGACEDVNECQRSTHNCHDAYRCDNTIGSFVCVRRLDCGTGYTMNVDFGLCEDVDECTLETHGCGPGYTCRNTRGSFKCDRIECPAGLVWSRGECVLDRNCTAATAAAAAALASGPAANGRAFSNVPKFVFDESVGECVPRDICESTRPCGPSERCVVAVESARGYDCVTMCAVGFRFDTIESKCVDVDECSERSAECGPNQRCINLAGHYDCRCESGFRMDQNRTCHDIDECANIVAAQDAGSPAAYACAHPRVCENTIGSYRCDRCAAGYRAKRWNRFENSQFLPSPFTKSNHEIEQDLHEGFECADIDECAAWSSNRCEFRCVNTVGGYRCECPAGFRVSRFDRISCVDIDECETESSPSDHQVFESNILDHSKTRNSRNETNGNEVCGRRLCVNTIGSYRCECPAGFRVSPDGLHCNDINECAERAVATSLDNNNHSICSGTSQTTVCINLLGTYECVRAECPSPEYRRTISGMSIRCELPLPSSSSAALPETREEGDDEENQKRNALYEQVTRSTDQYHKISYLYYSLYDDPADNDDNDKSGPPERNTYFYAVRYWPDPKLVSSSRHSVEQLRTHFDLRFRAIEPPDPWFDFGRHFRLATKGANEATIVAVRRLRSPRRRLVMELRAVGYQATRYQREKWIFTIVVSPHRQM